jgi:hypothetical protein
MAKLRNGAGRNPKKIRLIWRLLAQKQIAEGSSFAW